VISDITPSVTPTVSKTPKPVQTIVVVTPEDLTNSKPTWRFYYYAGDARIAMRVINGTTDLVFFLFADQLGSTNVTSDQSGQIVGLSLYMPWGESRAGGAGTRLTDYGFTRQREMDDSVGLMCYSARFYDLSGQTI
jgi:hypothetical protein